jgi:pimeloyl-ACP methyl ester carboxylesterase
MNEHFFEDRIYYRTNEFLPGRPTLVFAHGVSGSSSAWLPYEKIFENKYNILTHDIRGHGLSKKYPRYEDYEIKKFAGDLHDLVSGLHISKFVLISNSFAGLVHLEYLKMHSDTVAANIFTSPEIYLCDGFLAKILRPVFAVLTDIIGLLSFDPKPRGHVDYKNYPNSTDWSIGRNLADMRNTGLRAHFYTLRQSVAAGQKYEPEKISVPTLVIHGRKDTMVPMKNAIALSEKISGAEFVGLSGIDHNTVHNAVLEMSAATETFIEKNKNAILN